MGGVGARRGGPAVPAWQSHRRLRRPHVPRLRFRRRGDSRRCRGVPGAGHLRQCALRPRVVRAGARGPGGHGGHGVLVVARRPALGHSGPAFRRVRHGPRGRCDRHGHPDHLRRVLPPARSGLQRALQVVLGRGGRHRLGRRRRRAAGRASLRRPPQRPPGPRGRARLRRQSGRCQQRPHRPQRPVPAARHPRRTRRGRPDRRRHRRRRGPRHRHHPRRPHRGAGTAGHLRPGAPRGPAPAPGLHQVQHRPHAGRRGCRRDHQDGHGHAPRHPAPHPPRRTALVEGRLGRRSGGAADRSTRLAADERPAAPCRCLLLRHQRHQRTRHPGVARARARPRPGHRDGRAGDRAPRSAVGAVRQVPRGPRRTGSTTARATAVRRRDLRHRHRLLPRPDALPVRAPDRSGRDLSRGLPDGSGGTGLRPRRSQRANRRASGRRPPGLRGPCPRRGPRRR